MHVISSRAVVLCVMSVAPCHCRHVEARRSNTGYVQESHEERTSTELVQPVEQLCDIPYEVSQHCNIPSSSQTALQHLPTNRTAL